MARPVSQGDIAKILNPLVDEGVITGFRTNFIDQRLDDWSPEVTIKVADEALIANALELATEMLEPLGVSVSAEIRAGAKSRG